MQAAGAAERAQDEVARIEPALDRQLADRLGHREVDDLESLLGEPLGAEAEGLADAREGGARGGEVELHRTGEALCGRDAPEHEVRIRDRRLGSTEAVAGGPGLAPADSGPTRKA